MEKLIGLRRLVSSSKALDRVKRIRIVSLKELIQAFSVIVLTTQMRKLYQV